MIVKETQQIRDIIIQFSPSPDAIMFIKKKTTTKNHIPVVKPNFHLYCAVSEGLARVHAARARGLVFIPTVARDAARIYQQRAALRLKRSVESRAVTQQRETRIVLQRTVSRAVQCGRYLRRNRRCNFNLFLYHLTLQHWNIVPSVLAWKVSK